MIYDPPVLRRSDCFQPIVIAVHAHEPLRVSLEDLHQADTKGKWWLVGAAWGGDPLVDRQDEGETQLSVAPVETENTLLKLARKQGMNTDVRRSIFVVLMSSDVRVFLQVGEKGKLRIFFRTMWTPVTAYRSSS